MGEYNKYHAIRDEFNIRHLEKFALIYNTMFTKENINDFEYVMLYNDQGYVKLKIFNGIIYPHTVMSINKYDYDFVYTAKLLSNLYKNRGLIVGFTKSQMIKLNYLYKKLLQNGYRVENKVFNYLLSNKNPETQSNGFNRTISGIDFLSIEVDAIEINKINKIIK